MCVNGYHEKIKGDAFLWDMMTDPLDGYAVRPVVMDDLGRPFQYANCRLCRSTLAKAVSK